MFNSAKSILGNYIDTEKVSRFTFYSIEMERGENPEDIFYLCTLEEKYYVVFETDYILNSLSEIAQEAAEIFKADNLSPVCWVAKKGSSSDKVPLDTENIDELSENLIWDKSGSPDGYVVRYAVMEFAKTKAS